MPKNNKLLKLFLIFVFLSIVNILLYKILSPRVSAFGCFDDCFNYLAGYFMLHGKTLYSQIWFNHQPLMAYLSYLIQTFTHPINIYELVLEHRQFIFLVGIMMDALIIWRFGLAGVGFTLFYEFSKFYVFGDRFLAESLVVYFLVYMLGLIWTKLANKNLTFIDYLLSGIFTWLVLFMREPYSLVALAMYSILLLEKAQSKNRVISLVIFILLSIITLLVINTSLNDYFYQVFGQNGKQLFSQLEQINSTLINYLQIVFYPLYFYFGGVWNLFRGFILGIDTVFLLLICLYIKFFRKAKAIFVLGLLLGLANLRLVPAGSIFYGAFHLIPWYGMFIFATFLLLAEIIKAKKELGIILTLVLVSALLYLLISPQSYAREKVNSQVEFITNYGNILQIGEVVRLLSAPNNTLFLDGADDLIYWQAKRMSTYRYSWYTSFMPLFPIYTNARAEMFSSNPPDFYYAYCTKGQPQSSPPQNATYLYQPLYSYGKPTCLYIKKSIIPKISTAQWKAAKDFKYELTTNY
jgi:hypothetical protein